MRLYRTRHGILVEKDAHYHLLNEDWDRLINRVEMRKVVEAYLAVKNRTALGPEIIENDCLPPISRQEIWAAGVTYQRSKAARMDESRQAGGGDFYDKVYSAERPELFFKATASRTVGHGARVKIRKDSSWNVPEPELTLFINSKGTVAGYTIGNDMSSRDIEGENPLYLPQAKTYDGSAAIGPCLYMPEGPLPLTTEIRMVITRKPGIEMYTGTVRLNQMKRSFDELSGYLFRECSFPAGCFLMTGTGIVPPNDFTLEQGDEILISIAPIGTLVNTVA